MNGLAVQLFLVLLWGFVATAAMGAVLFGSQRLGYSRLSLPLLIGTLFTERRSSAVPAGFLFYLLGGWLFAFIYYFLFAAIGHAGILVGMLVGGAHGFVLLTTLLPLLPHLHPRMASSYDGPAEGRILEPPGFLGVNYGYRTPLVTMIAQMLYGGILGATFPLSP